MLSKEEIKENAKILSDKEYSKLVMENYLSKSSREKCMELEQINEILRLELEKYKSIALGNEEEKEIIIAENYDHIINEADIVLPDDIGNNNMTENIGEELKGIIDHVRTLTPNDEYDDNVNYIFRVYHILDDMNECMFCDGKYRLISSVPKVSFTITDNKAVVMDEIFTGYKCDKCGAEIQNSFSYASKQDFLPDIPYMTPAASVYMIIQKYLLCRSFKQQELYWRNFDICFSQPVMCYIVNEVCDKYFIPLYEVMKKELLSRDFICADVQDFRTVRLSKNNLVLHESTSSDVFVYRTPKNDDRPIVILDINEDSSFEDDPVNFEEPESFLSGYCGIVHTDKPERFDFPERKFTVIGMWDKVNRMFVEAESCLPERFSDDFDVKSCIKLLSRLYDCEKENADIEEDNVRLEIRELCCKDITDALIQIAAEFCSRFENKEIMGTLGKAYKYITDHSSELELYYLDARISVDNEICKAILDDFVSGKYRLSIKENNYKRSIAILSIIQTAQLNNLDPLRYLIYYINNCGKENKEQMMPWNCPEICREFFMYDMKPRDIIRNKFIKYDNDKK